MLLKNKLKTYLLGQNIQARMYAVSVSTRRLKNFMKCQATVKFLKTKLLHFIIL